MKVTDTNATAVGIRLLGWVEFCGSDFRLRVSPPTNHAMPAERRLVAPPLDLNILLCRFNC